MRARSTTELKESLWISDSSPMIWHKRILATLLIFLLLGGGHLLAEDFPGEVRRVPVDHLTPTQQVFGYGSVLDIILTRAKAARETHPQNSEYALQDFLHRMEKVAGKEVDAVEGPSLWGDGRRIYLRDGHHRVSALALLLDSNVPLERLPSELLNLGFTEDTRLMMQKNQKLWPTVRVQSFPRTKESLAIFFANQGIGHFKKESLSAQEITLLNQVKKGKSLDQETAQKLLALYERLPLAMHQMTDFPDRSAIGNLMSRLGVQGGTFTDYLEFHLAEFIRDYCNKNGEPIPLWLLNDRTEPTTSELQQFLDFLKRSGGFKFLRDRIRPGHEEEALRQVSSMEQKMMSNLGCASDFAKML